MLPALWVTREKKANARAMIGGVAVGAIACVVTFGACNFFGISVM